MRGLAGHIGVVIALLLNGGVAMARDIVMVDKVRMIHVEDQDAGLVSMQVVVEAGSLADPEGKEGLADLTAHMLLRGTKTRTYEQIMDQVHDIGSTLEAAAQKEFMYVAGDFLPRYQDRFVEVLSDILTNPTFPAEGFEQERSLAMEFIKNMRNDDAELARHFFARYLYRGHPMGRPTRGYLRSLAHMAPEDCAQFWRTHAHKGNLIVTVAGAIDQEGAKRLVRKLTARIPDGKRVQRTLPPPPKVFGIHVLVVDKPERTQTQVVMGRSSISWQSPDLFPLIVGNTAFGGTFTARLMREIREKRGWSYGASSTITAGREFGTHAIRFFPATKDTVPAIELVLGLLDDAKKNGLEASEVEFARNYLANHFPFRVETARKRADELLANHVFGRPADFIQTFVQNVQRQTPAKVKEALSRWYDNQDLVITVVGTAKDLVEDLRKLKGVGTVDVVPYDSDELP